MKRRIEIIEEADTFRFVGDGFRVHNFFPKYPILTPERLSPFILLDYNAPWKVPGLENPKGIGAHPHRGFETVTFVYDGAVEHRDSNGGGGIIHKGDVQWMSASSGVLHSEFHESQWAKEGGIIHMVQLWVNLPSIHKMDRPKYQAIINTDIPKVKEGNSIVEVIAGEYKGIKGIASTHTPIHAFNASIESGATMEFSFPKQYNTIMLVVQGSVRVNEEQIVGESGFALLDNEGEEFSVTASSDAKVLILSGEAIDEPVFAHGPFVMNTEEEIIQAYDDYNSGKFGPM